MNAKKTEILKLKESSRVKITFGNRSEDKVILSFAAKEDALIKYLSFLDL